jgi:mannosyltransferase
MAETLPAGAAGRIAGGRRVWAAPVSWWQSLSRRGAMLTAAVVAAVSCLTGLGYQPLSWDEAVTLSAAQHSPGRLSALLAHTDAPLGLYYLAMHGWIRLAGVIGIIPSEGWLRLPSAVAGVGAVVLVVLFAADWYGPRTGLLAGVLLAVHPLFVFYAHDARPYTLATFLVIAASILFVRARRNPAPGRLVAYAAVATLTVYAHLFAVLALLVHALVILVRGPRRIAWAVVAVAVAAATAPVVLLGARQTGEIGWIPAPSAAAVASVLLKLVGGIAPALVLAGITLAVSVRRRRRLGRRALFVLAWALVPPLLLVVADLYTPVLVARYALVAVPGIAIAVAAACLSDRSRLVVAGTVLALVAAAVTSVIQQAQPYKYEDFRAASDLVDDTARTGDAVLYLPAATRVGIDPYAAAEPGEQQAVDIALQHGGSPTRADQIAGVEVPAGAIAGLLHGHADVYLVGDPLRQALGSHASPTDRAKISALLQGYTPVWSHAFGVITVTLLSQRAPHSPH